MLREPPKDRSLFGHCGRHDTTLATAQGHPRFGELVERCAKRLKGTPKELLWSFYCKQGRHRSVAVAMLISKAMAGLGARVVVEHIEHRNGGWKNLCHDCAFCAYGTQEKARLVALTKEKLLELL